MDLGDRKELSPSANLTLISVLGQWDPSFFRGCGKLIQLHLLFPALEQVSANRYVTMVIYQKLLPQTKKRGVFYLSLKMSSLNRLASYDEYPPDLFQRKPSFSCFALYSKAVVSNWSGFGTQFPMLVHTISHSVFCGAPEAE